MVRLKGGRGRTCAGTVNRGILCVQLSVRDTSLRLDGRTGVSSHDSVCPRTPATTPATAPAEAESLADTQIW
jgi:hypothetical protein